MLVIIYARVSTEEQARSGFSLAEQLRLCRGRAQELAKGSGESLSCVEFIDDTSGEVMERPGLQSALALIRQQPAACFVCLDPDRLARRLMHQLLITDEIERNACRLEFVQHDYQETPEGRLFYQMRGAIAEFEKAKILERTSRGQRGKIAAGGLPHIVRMYGYDFRVGAGKHALAREVLVPHPEEANWVQQMFRWCAQEGIGPSLIADRLNGLGVPTKTRAGAWQHTQVQRILRHPTYATGRLALGKKDHKGIGVARRLPKVQRLERGISLTAKSKPKDQWHYVEIDPLVEEDLWQKAQEVLSGFRIGARATGGRDRLRPLTGLGRCGLCGSALYYLNGSKIVCSGRYRHYWDRTLKPSGCTLPAKRREAVEAAVWQRVESFIRHPQIYTAEMEKAEQEWQRSLPDQAEIEGERVALAKELADREGEAERLGLLFAKGLWPAEKALPAIEKVNQQMATIRSRLKELDKKTEMVPPQDGPSMRTFLKDATLLADVQATLDHLTPERKAELMRLAVYGFIMTPSGRGEPPAVKISLRP